MPVLSVSSANYMDKNTYLGQNSSASSKSSLTSFLNTFLHFLQTMHMSVVLSNSWSCVSSWHSGQSNHLRQHGALMATWAFRTCLHILLRKIDLKKLKIIIMSSINSKLSNYLNSFLNTSSFQIS